MLVRTTRSALPKRAEECIYVLDGERLDVGGEIKTRSDLLQPPQGLAVATHRAAGFAFVFCQNSGLDPDFRRERYGEPLHFESEHRCGEGRIERLSDPEP